MGRERPPGRGGLPGGGELPRQQRDGILVHRLVGNAANQRVRAHATAAIEAGKIQGKTEDGKTISGSCRDGGEMVIQEKNGVPLLLPKGKKHIKR